ncbi:helix-turn-helix domain-containing protein [Psychrobacter sp. P11G3]|uniref:helix-turn-helix domain-containing protein n=1 Tax=Psychrobacter sp. P11G3 TaxID=1699623 RepID=UPI00070F04FF|nr:helix-turn-helix transcriptional regulator [Psychrobacter sp. P11G3]KRG36125.1 XRE family transcriptional regulator [Psychrobacter sp. P11G3]
MIKLNLPVLFAKKGLRVADADRMSKLGRSTLYRMYNNEVTRIDFETLNELCKLLDCKPGDIILYKEDDPSGNNER